MIIRTSHNHTHSFRLCAYMAANTRYNIHLLLFAADANESNLILSLFAAPYLTARTYYTTLMLLRTSAKHIYLRFKWLTTGPFFLSCFWVGNFLCSVFFFLPSLESFERAHTAQWYSYSVYIKNSISIE